MSEQIECMLESSFNTFANPCAVNVGFSSFIIQQIRGMITNGLEL